MDTNDKTRRLLDELAKCTGIVFEVAPQQKMDPEKLNTALEDLLAPYRKGYDLSDFWLSFLNNTISGEEVEEGWRRFQLKDETEALLYLLYFPHGYGEEVEAILRDLSGEGAWLLEPDDLHLILLKTPRQPYSGERLREEAGTIADTIAAEAMVKVAVSYDEVVKTLSGLPDSLKKAQFAEDCGRSFYPGERVYSYHELGLGKLVGKLSREDCLEYLEDHLGNFRFDSMDRELSVTVQSFFEEGLSIARTSRRLYVHRNTLVYRLDKFEKLSGLDLRRFDDAVVARLAMLMEIYVRR